MDGRVREVNRVVKEYDKYLVALRGGNGVIHVYRKTNGLTAPHLVFSLTEDWGPNSPPREWGLQVIYNRLAAHDLWKDETVVERLEKEAIQDAASAERATKNSIEAFLYDYRRQFAKAHNDVNTSSLAKIDRRALKGA